jgi:spore coat polysaccharide biosynthesis protein SpsF (cytidylyltransferase family)
MDSERLPGKVLMSLAGKPMLQYLMESAARAKALDSIMVATSDRISDDAIAKFCAGQGYTCFRGALDDVADRLLKAAAAHGLDYIVRLNADSPLLDWRLINRAATLAAERQPDVVTNAFPRSFPKGQSVEAISVETLKQTYTFMSELEDKEHVTRYFYNHAARFRILNFASGEHWGRLNLCVDTADDFARVERLIQHLDGPPWQYSVEELVALLREALATV